jgi:hypothetical protein
MKSYAGLSELALKNVVALADMEEPDPGENGEDNETTWQIGEKTMNWPPDYLKETEALKIKCCRIQGDLKKCDYETC